MTNEETLESLTAKIKKIMPEIENYYKSGNYVVFGEDLKEIKDAFDRNINLEDILICLERKCKEDDVALIDGYDVEYLLQVWRLNSPLQSQAPETIKYLDKII